MPGYGQVSRMRLQILVVRELRKQRGCVSNREPFDRAGAKYCAPTSHEREHEREHKREHEREHKREHEREHKREYKRERLQPGWGF